MEKLGGKDSLIYTREETIVENVVNQYKLETSASQSDRNEFTLEQEPVPVRVGGE